MSLCQCVALYVHCLSWSEGKEIAVTTLKILDITIKFSCLGNPAPEICAPLHDVKKQDQHFFLPSPLLGGCCQGDMFVACWMLSFGCGPVLEYAWLVSSDGMFSSVLFKAFRFWLFLLVVVGQNFSYDHLCDFEITDRSLGNWFLVFI